MSCLHSQWDATLKYFQLDLTDVYWILLCAGCGHISYQEYKDEEVMGPATRRS